MGPVNFKLFYSCVIIVIMKNSTREATRRVRKLDSPHPAEGDGARPQDDLPRISKEGAGAEVVHDDRREVQGATGEAKLDEEVDLSDVGVQIDSSENRVKKSGDAEDDSHESSVGETLLGQEDDQSVEEEPTEYWNSRMQDAWSVLDSFRTGISAFILLLGIICLPSVSVPQQAPSSAHTADITRLRAITFTVDQVAQAIPELASRRMSAKMMSNIASLFDKSTGGTGLFALIVAATLHGFLHARGSISGMHISRVDTSDEHLEDFEDNPYAETSSSDVKGSSDASKFCFSHFDCIQLPSIIPLLSTFRRCQDLDPQTQNQVLRFNREIGKRAIDTNILTSQARNDIQVQGEQKREGGGRAKKSFFIFIFEFSFDFF